MKTLFAIYMIFTSLLSYADDVHEASAIKGKVLEIKEVESYTYLRLKTKDDEIWAAVLKAPVNLGAEVTISNVMIMNNFESKTLKKTFKSIVFGTLSGNSPTEPGNINEISKVKSTKTNDTSEIHVTKAIGTNSRTVAEIMINGTELNGQTVLVRGKVVKFNPEIMGKNWIHIRDGSGSATDNTNDVLVTTMNNANIGDIVTAKGIVRTNQDFGAGYSYKVLIEQAIIQK